MASVGQGYEDLESFLETRCLAMNHVGSKNTSCHARSEKQPFGAKSEEIRLVESDTRQ